MERAGTPTPMTIVGDTGVTVIAAIGARIADGIVAARTAVGPTTAAIVIAIITV